MIPHLFLSSILERVDGLKVKCREGKVHGEKQKKAQHSTSTNTKKRYVKFRIRQN